MGSHVGQPGPLEEVCALACHAEAAGLGPVRVFEQAYSQVMVWLGPRDQPRLDRIVESVAILHG